MAAGAGPPAGRACRAASRHAPETAGHAPLASGGAAPRGGRRRPACPSAARGPPRGRRPARPSTARSRAPLAPRGPSRPPAAQPLWPPERRGTAGRTEPPHTECAAALCVGIDCKLTQSKGWCRHRCAGCATAGAVDRFAGRGGCSGLARRRKLVPGVCVPHPACVPRPRRWIGCPATATGGPRAGARVVPRRDSRHVAESAWAPPNCGDDVCLGGAGTACVRLQASIQPGCNEGASVGQTTPGGVTEHEAMHVFTPPFPCSSLPAAASFQCISSLGRRFLRPVPCLDPIPDIYCPSREDGPSVS
jgi:hypothetical protein